MKKKRDIMDSGNLTKHLLECSASRDVTLYFEPKSSDAMDLCTPYENKMPDAMNARPFVFFFFLPPMFMSA